MNDALSPTRSKTQSKLNKSNTSITSPQNKQLLQLKHELIDENLFVEALTLCALSKKDD